MTYEEIEITTLEGKQTHIILDLGDGGFKSFPADESNPEYVTWAVAEGIMEAPVVVEPADIEPEVTESVDEPVVEPEATEPDTE
jgi:hypothetical protein